jgi:hypothetical protein
MEKKCMDFVTPTLFVSTPSPTYKITAHRTPNGMFDNDFAIPDI